jgi:hypothetical protein
MSCICGAKVTLGIGRILFAFTGTVPFCWPAMKLKIPSLHKYCRLSGIIRLFTGTLLGVLPCIVLVLG